MNKFTIFTVILAVSVATMTLDLAVRDFLVKTGQASVFGSEISPVLAPEHTDNSEHTTDISNIVSSSSAVTPPSVVMTPSPGTTILAASDSLMTEAMIKEAGFNPATVTEKHFDGKIFQLLDITKIPVDGISFHEISVDGVAVTSVTEIVLRDEIRALQLYILLQNKTKPYIDLKLNETNAYGDRSFYINHEKKPDEAFLVVKIGRRIYAFAYVKTYHPQTKELIKLLSNL